MKKVLTIALFLLLGGALAQAQDVKFITQEVTLKGKTQAIRRTPKEEIQRLQNDNQPVNQRLGDIVELLEKELNKANKLFLSGVTSGPTAQAKQYITSLKTVHKNVDVSLYEAEIKLYDGDN